MNKTKIRTKTRNRNTKKHIKGGQIVPYSLRNAWHSIRFIPLQIHTHDCITNTFYLLGYCNRADAVYMALKSRRTGIIADTVIRMINRAYPYSRSIYYIFPDDNTYADIPLAIPQIPNRAYYAYVFPAEEIGHAFVLYVGERDQEIYHLAIDPQTNQIYDLMDYLRQYTNRVQEFSFIISDNVAPGENRITRDIMDDVIDNQIFNQGGSPLIGPGANSQFHGNSINVWSATSINQNQNNNQNNNENNNENVEVDRWMDDHNQVWSYVNNYWMSGRRWHNYTQDLTELLHLGMAAFIDKSGGQWQRFNGWRSSDDTNFLDGYAVAPNWWITEWQDSTGLMWHDGNGSWDSENGFAIENDISIEELKDQHDMTSFVDNYEVQWQRFEGWQGASDWISD